MLKYINNMNNPQFLELTDKKLETIKTGVIYLYGHGKQHQPVIVFQIHKILKHSIN